LAIGAVLLMLAVSVAVYPWLPDVVPIHFDIRGAPDGFASRAFGAFLLPIISVAFLALLRLRNGASALVATLVLWFLAGMHVLVLRAALSGEALGGAIWVLCGAFFVALGLVLPRVRRNRWVGVRTPWAMRSPEIWARTQRIGGQAMLAGGIVVLLTAWGTGPLALALRGVALLGASIVPIAYSWWASRTVPS
jgi:uncharacterized membrane protein